MASKFTPDIRGGLIERVAAGASQADAARAVGITLPTFKKWLQRGRKEGEGEYADFAKAIAAAREQARNRPEPMTAEELRLEVSKAARRGSVQAMKLYWEMIRGEDEDEGGDEEADPLDELDEVAAKRAARIAA